VEWESEVRVSAHLWFTTEMAESEKLTPKPDPKTKTPDPAPISVSLQILNSDSYSALAPALPCFLHTFHIHHTIHTDHTNHIIHCLLHILYNSYQTYTIYCFSKNSNPVLNNVAGLPIRFTPDTAPCPTLVYNLEQDRDEHGSVPDRILTIFGRIGTGLYCLGTVS